jgi:hypothetical protein
MLPAESRLAARISTISRIEVMGLALAVILDALRPLLPGTISTTIDFVLNLHIMTNDATAAVLTSWSKCRDGTFKAVKDMLLATHHHFKALIVLISTDFTLSHCFELLSKARTLLSP